MLHQLHTLLSYLVVQKLNVHSKLFVAFYVGDMLGQSSSLATVAIKQNLGYYIKPQG